MKQPNYSASMKSMQIGDESHVTNSATKLAPIVTNQDNLFKHQQ